MLIKTALLVTQLAQWGKSRAFDSKSKKNENEIAFAHLIIALYK